MRTRLIVVGMGLLCLLPSQWAEADIYNDGGVHDILSGSYERIDVDNPPPPAPAYTTVNIEGTAEVGSVDTFNNSRATVADDAYIIDSISAHDNSQVTMNGGTVEQHYIAAYDNSQVTINSGGTELRARDNSQVTINGGEIPRLEASGDSRLIINGGGLAGDNHIAGNSHVTIRGGTTNWWFTYEDSQLTMNGGSIRGVVAFGSTPITFIGSDDFAIYEGPHRTDLVFSGYGNFLNPFPAGHGYSLWGRLASGELLEGVDLYMDGDSQISFVPLPGAALLGMLGLGVAGWRLRHRTP